MSASKPAGRVFLHTAVIVGVPGISQTARTNTFVKMRGDDPCCRV